MHKLVACVDRPVWELLRASRAENAMPPRKRFTHVFKSYPLQVAYRGSGGDREPGAADAHQARHLQHPLFLTAQPVDLDFDHLAQTLRHVQSDFLKRQVEFALAVLA